ncbi:MAG: riboflavin synthase, partial [Winkia neuii]|nr:riboflavin synthase [Winkia neuii]
MVTGLGEATGKILAVTDNEGGKRIKISAPFASSLSFGESVAVNGVCLTVVDFADDGFTADV